MVARKGRPTCFLHIGPPKTGSSTISHFVEGNVEALAAQGLFVPQMPALKGRPMNGHGIFANVDELNARGELKPKALLWPELEEVASEGRQNIVLTSESFAHAFRDAVVLDRILTFFERHGYDVTVIAYLRDQPSSLNSSYVQSQKRLVKRMTFEEFVDEAARTGKVDPWRYLEHIIDNPRLTFSAGCFETAIKSGLEKDFSKRLGLPDDLELSYPTVRNPNAGAKAVFAAQKILEQIGDVRVSKLAGFKKINRRFKTHFEERGWTEAPYVGLDQELYGRIRDYYDDANERFSQRFFGASWKDLSPNRSYAKKEFDPATATEAELAEIEEVVADMVGMIQRLSVKQDKEGVELDAEARDRVQAGGPVKTDAERKARRQLKKKRRARAAKASQVVAKGGAGEKTKAVKAAAKAEGRAAKEAKTGGKGKGEGSAAKGAKAAASKAKGKGANETAKAPAKAAGAKAAGSKPGGGKAAAAGKTGAGKAKAAGAGKAATAGKGGGLKAAAKKAAVDKPKNVGAKAAAKAAGKSTDKATTGKSVDKTADKPKAAAKAAKAGPAKRSGGGKGKTAQAAE